ncbi:MAG: hypothetical protein M0O96_00055 [Desulforhopalus sp.]|nr:hypothetical protein [Desulforhopalus sp.]
MKLQTAACIVAGATTLLLSGCGYKDDPVPPQSVVPLAIENLRYVINDKGAELSWSYPSKTLKGAPLEDISSFELFSTGVPMDEYCKTCPIPFGKPQALPGGAVYDGNQLRSGAYQAGGLTSGYRYFFKIRSKDSWFAESPDSNIVTFVYSIPPAAPSSLRADTGDGEVSLHWAAVKILQDGARLPAPVQYQVMRSTGGALSPIGQLQDGLSWKDTTVNNGGKYRYAVRSVIDFDGSLVPSLDSATVSVSPVDATAPEAPSHVQVVAMTQGVKVFWVSSDSSDLAGYRIYRSGTGKNYKLVGKMDATATLFNDSEADANSSWYYVITAVDKIGNESNRSQAGHTRD